MLQLINSDGMSVYLIDSNRNCQSVSRRVIGSLCVVLSYRTQQADNRGGIVKTCEQVVIKRHKIIKLARLLVVYVPFGK